MFRVAIVLCSGMLLSCAMGPDYSRLDIPTNDNYRMAAEGRDLPSLADMPWWELYRDPELQKLIRISLEENKDLERAVAVVEEYGARLFVARTDFAPKMDAVGNAPLPGGAESAFPALPIPSTTTCKETWPGSWTSGDASAVPMRPHEAISWLGRRTGARSFSSW